tara:strand:+ start:8049 stop:9176 length:1128 start_codon:yes stop_codon:yes gene_type:complete
MKHVPFHKSGLSYIYWEKYINSLKNLKSFHGSMSLQSEVEDLCRIFCKGKNFYFVNSGTAALELALMSLKLEAGSEVILPSLTFSSCANAIIRSGAKPCFCEISLPNLHISLDKIKELVNENTKVIMVVEYAGIRAELKNIRKFCDERGIYLLLDSAQAFGATEVEDQSVLADFVCYSFHDTKVFSCGEGGLLVVNYNPVIETVEIMLEKGTNRLSFVNGQIDKYTWHDIGSSFILSDINLLLLKYQLAERERILMDKLSAIKIYIDFFESFQSTHIRAFSRHDKASNGHIFWLLFKNNQTLKNVQSFFDKNFIHTTTHYVPLHSAPYALKNGYKHSQDMSLTDCAGDSLLRLPVISAEVAQKVKTTFLNYFEKI